MCNSNSSNFIYIEKQFTNQFCLQVAKASLAGGRSYGITADNVLSKK